MLTAPLCPVGLPGLPVYFRNGYDKASFSNHPGGLVMNVRFLPISWCAVLCVAAQVAADEPVKTDAAVKVKLPAGTKVTLPPFDGLPTDPKQTLPGLVVKFPPVTKGKVKNYFITIEPPKDKKVASLTKNFSPPPALTDPRFRVDIPEGATLKFATATVKILPDKRAEVTVPKEVEFELPAGVTIKPGS